MSCTLLAFPTSSLAFPSRARLTERHCADDSDGSASAPPFFVELQGSLR